MPETVIGFTDPGIDPDQGNNRRGNEQNAAGSFFSEKSLSGLENLISNQLGNSQTFFEEFVDTVLEGTFRNNRKS